VVNLDEVVSEVAESDGCGMVLDLFAEAINLGPNDKTLLKRIRSPAKTAILNFGLSSFTTFLNKF